MVLKKTKWLIFFSAEWDKPTFLISGLSPGISLPELSYRFVEVKGQGHDQWFKLFLGLHYKVLWTLYNK